MYYTACQLNLPGPKPYKRLSKPCNSNSFKETSTETQKQNNIKQTNAVKPTKQTYRKPNTNKLQTCNIGKLRPRPGRRASCVGRPSGAQPATQKS